MATDIKRRFGERLREIREQRGISQEKLATDADLHRTYVSLIERGERNVTIETVEKLATALDVEMAELMPRRRK